MSNSFDTGDVIFDVPAWISVSEFVEGLESGDTNDPLSSLFSCKLYKKNENPEETISEFGMAGGDIFEVEFLVPFGELRELSLNRFRAVKVDSDGNVWGTEEIKHEIKDDGNPC
jgi:hypothetical protein